MLYLPMLLKKTLILKNNTFYLQIKYPWLGQRLKAESPICFHGNINILVPYYFYYLFKFPPTFGPL